ALLGVRSIVSTWQIRRGSRYGSLDLCQGRLQGGFLRVVERSFQYRAAFAFEPLKDLIRRDFAHQYEERCSPRLNGGGGLLHPFVVNADIRQIPAERAGCCAK